MNVLIAQLWSWDFVQSYNHRLATYATQRCNPCTHDANAIFFIKRDPFCFCESFVPRMLMLSSNGHIYHMPPPLTPSVLLKESASMSQVCIWRSRFPQENKCEGFYMLYLYTHWDGEWNYWSNWCGGAVGKGDKWLSQDLLLVQINISQLHGKPPLHWVHTQTVIV